MSTALQCRVASLTVSSHALPWTPAERTDDPAMIARSKKRGRQQTRAVLRIVHARRHPPAGQHCAGSALVGNRCVSLLCGACRSITPWRLARRALQHRCCQRRRLGHGPASPPIRPAAGPASPSSPVFSYIVFSSSCSRLRQRMRLQRFSLDQQLRVSVQHARGVGSLFRPIRLVLK